ncbi:c-type cytochrome [Neisseriaceae bacterium TC5R-5]|nr:c-type cytochrome [Neisseriaceae bacterium TC5R-5]
MFTQQRYRLRVLVGIISAVAALPASFALDITLPAETAAYKASELPGYRLVQQNCMTCHSAQYVQYQPSTSPRSYWEATVTKMKHSFAAPFADEDVPAMVDYLVKTYGAEQGHVATAPATTVATAVPPKATAPAVPVAGSSLQSEALLKANNCTACHAVEQKVVGPAFKEVAAKYAGKSDALQQVAANIREGGAGKWGTVPMPPFPGLTPAELDTLAKWVLSR